MKVAYHPRMGTLFMIFSSKLYESVDNGNWFEEKQISGLPKSYKIQDILFREDDDLYVILIMNKTTKRYGFKS